jgi:hypothetical protein
MDLIPIFRIPMCPLHRNHRKTFHSGRLRKKRTSSVRRHDEGKRLKNGSQAANERFFAFPEIRLLY